MIPILYASTETIFASNGLGRLSDAISCEVAEKRNGTYELKLVYPTNGIHFDQIVAGNYIAAIHSDQKDVQPFRIYRISEEIDGQVEINAHHISYALNSIIAKPFTAGSCAEAITKLNTATTFVNSCPFTFWTDKSVTANLNNVTPRDVRSLLGGASGSLLDVYGTGEYEFDIYDVKLYLHRGSDTDVQIRYGVNMTDYEHTADSSDAYNAIVPFWYDENSGEMVTLPEWYLTPTGQTVTDLRLFALDMSDDFDSKPTESQLRTKAQSKLDNSGAWRPAENWKVSFVQLWQSPEYAEVAPLQRLNLCDTCLVIYNGRSIREKVVETTYDVLRERYISMELGEPKTSFANMVIRQATSEIVKQVVSKSFLDEAIAHATDLITGALGGYLVIGTDANGQPNELLIMDNPDKTQAENVWRFNSGGLGHSHSGYSGPFSDVALTADGKINAAMITVGILNANVIRAGIIADTQGNNSWNLETGRLITAVGEIGDWEISSGSITKTITVGDDEYKIEIKPSSTNLTPFISITKRDGIHWLPVIQLSPSMLIFSNPDDAVISGTAALTPAIAALSKSGITVYQGTEPNERRIDLSPTGLSVYDNGDLATVIDNRGFWLYDTQGDPIFQLYRTYASSAMWFGVNIYPISSNTWAIGSLQHTLAVIFTGAIEIVNSTGYIDWHFNNDIVSDYTARLIEESSGVLRVYNSLINPSDERLKENIREFTDNDLALIGKLKPKAFKFKTGTYQNAGLIAQEVIQAEEELGITDSLLIRGTGEEVPDPKHPGETMTDYYAVDYNCLTSLLLAQVQKLTKQVEDLTAQVSALKNH